MIAMLILHGTCSENDSEIFSNQRRKTIYYFNVRVKDDYVHFVCNYFTEKSLT